MSVASDRNRQMAGIAAAPRYTPRDASKTTWS
jgi:hypothetical protein